MWCKNCNLETNEAICPVCGLETSEDLPVEIYWCNDCRIPVIHVSTAADKGICPVCHGKTRYLTADLRPVFPEERLLIALLLDKDPDALMQKSVWATGSRYYIDGKSLSISTKTFETADIDKINDLLEKSADAIDYTFFDENIHRFVLANQHRLAYLKDEAFSFVRKAAERFKEENIVISFSGGKDSTVTADVVTKALSNPSLVHIFGNTTLEFPATIEYANHYRESHPLAIFMVAHNDEQVFYDVCEDIGPPARMMRWCCSMFKTGPITRIISSMYRSQQILTFYGIRKSESVSRSKYNRIEDDAESVKIQQQTVASPIFFWKDIDIWLYMLAEEVDFNAAYCLGVIHLRGGASMINKTTLAVCTAPISITDDSFGDFTYEWIIPAANDSCLLASGQEESAWGGGIVDHGAAPQQECEFSFDAVDAVQKADALDYSIAAASGLLCSLIDIFWVGKFNLAEAEHWGKEKASQFVLGVAQSKGYKGETLAGAIRFLEKAFPIPADLLTSEFGGGLQHHLRDFGHHPTLLGLFFSLLTQFTGLGFGTDTEGSFIVRKLPDQAAIVLSMKQRCSPNVKLPYQRKKLIP